MSSPTRKMKAIPIKIEKKSKKLVVDATPRLPTASVHAVEKEPNVAFSSGVTFQKMNNFVALQELKVLRAIVEREEWLRRLSATVNSIKSGEIDLLSSAGFQQEV